MPWIDHDLLVFLDDIDEMQPDTQLFGHPQCVVALGTHPVLLTDGMGMAFHAKPGKKIDALDVDALVHDHARGEQRIEPTGNQGNGFMVFAHGVAGVEWLCVCS